LAKQFQRRFLESDQSKTRIELYNYADDNTLSYSDSDKNNLEKTLEMERLELIKWFSINQMKANPEKFQAIAVDKKTKDKNVTFNPKQGDKN
jgi:succinate dehydrogenase flavin-adding protein (antitoxin of CptAB toxin-antitoxin module)